MTVKLYHGDCLDVMPELAENSVDTIITDPPYGLEFMGKDWDHGIPGVRFWEAALRVAKPGAFLLAFGGTRTHHRLMVAIEDAGWELRDTMMWVYGSGFPKSYDIGKGMDKHFGAEREVVGEYSDNGRKCPKHQNTHAAWEGNPTVKITAPATDAARTWDGWGTALKPAWEPIIVAMAPRDGTFVNNALTWGVAGLWIDGARVPTDDTPPAGGDYGDDHETSIWGNGNERKRVFRQARPSGRWPANLIHDGSAEVVGLFPAAGASRAAPRGGTNPNPMDWGNERADGDICKGHNDNGGSAARFFYCAKASRSERDAGLEEMDFEGGGEYRPNDPDENTIRQRLHGRKRKGNFHPTVKPIDLLRYLCRLTKTPTGGLVLDPFMGSGSTGCAAVLEGRDFVGIEQEREYVEIAGARIQHWMAEAQEAQEAPVQMTLEVT